MNVGFSSSGVANPESRVTALLLLGFIKGWNRRQEIWPEKKSLSSNLGRFTSSLPPLPLGLWNQELSENRRNNLWGSITSGQNLEPQRLSLAGPPMIFISHGVAVGKHDRIADLCARSDVTTFAGIAVENFHFSSADIRGLTRIFQKQFPNV